jgi:signal transduction histidine kinase
MPAPGRPGYLRGVTRRIERWPLAVLSVVTAPSALAIALGASRLAVATTAVTAAWIVAFSVRQQRAYVAAQRQQADRQERLRIARELHDVVAHSLSLIAVQAGVGSYVAAEQPQEAARALASIEAASRGALDEMRRLLGLLRAGDDAEPDLAPAHGLADLSHLIKGASEAGLPVELEVRGTRGSIAPGVDLAAYRIVQEALTNVIKHAARASTLVVVTYARDTVSIEVVNDGSAIVHAVTASAGHGITGMAERAALYAGEFSAGPRPDGGFRVAARLALGRAYQDGPA